MDLGLSGRAALVTGGSKGIGRATALRLAAEGAAVMICARGAAALDETTALAAGTPGRIVAAQADLTDPRAIEEVCARCVRELGALDVLVNNAGSARTGDFLKLADQEWLDDFSLKFFGYVRMARTAIKRMERSGGVIINVIGTGGLMPSAGYMIGGAANAALNHFTKALAQQGARCGVRVVGVNPGPIMTERLMRMFAGRNPETGRASDEDLKRMTPLGRPGKPEEVADLIAFLASSRAAFVHGANITIDGGANRGLMG